MSREPWALKRTAQCKKCPWRKDVDPFDIPNGYDPAKHRALEKTIAIPGAINIGAPLNVMSCHEEHDGHCVGWLMNQLGPGNNIGLRMAMMNCMNAGKLRTVGDQHACFEDTLPDSVRT